jgi:hypothetical protein
MRRREADHIREFRPPSAAEGDWNVTIEEYFEQPDTPAAGSPVGILVVKIIAKNPGIDFEGARTEACNLLGQAAGRKRYQVPAVLSPQEKAENIAGMRERFRQSRQAA